MEETRVKGFVEAVPLGRLTATAVHFQTLSRRFQTLSRRFFKTLSRRAALGLLLAGWMIVILGRLAQLQVIQHSKYRQAARAQQEKREAIPAERGAIVDCNGNVLAMNAPTKLA